MKRCVVVFVLAMMFFAPSAFAQDIQIKTDCRVPAPQTAGADYVPGVDAKGNPVKPANIEGALQPVVYPIDIPVSLDMMRFLNLSIPDVSNDAVKLEANIAYVKVYEDGRVEYNGQNISDRVSYSCADEEEGAVPSLPPPAEGAVTAPPLELEPVPEPSQPPVQNTPPPHKEEPAPAAPAPVAPPAAPPPTLPANTGPPLEGQYP